jgi:hypothetical protein
MDTSFLGVIGILVSIALYYLGYRQTIGAKKEKIKATNFDIEKTLVKRIVLESFSPTIKDINRIIETKARETNLREDDLNTPSQFIDTIFTRIFETDFISPDQRNEIVQKLTSAISKFDEKRIEDAKAEELASGDKQKNTGWVLSLLLSVFASIIGTFAVFWYNIFESNKIMTTTLLLTVLMSFVIIVIFTIIMRFREPLKQNSSSISVHSSASFEIEVKNTLKSIGIKYLTSTSNQGHDFFLETKGKKIIIEAKGWNRRVPTSFLQQTISRLKNASVESKADEAIIVTRQSVNIPASSLLNSSVKIMNLRELRHYLVG